MKAPIRVVSQEEYDKWFAGKVQAAATARAPRGNASAVKLPPNDARNEIHWELCEAVRLCELPR